MLSTQHMIISRMRGKYNVIENRRWPIPDFSFVKMDSIYHEGDAFFHDLHQEQIMLDQDAKDISNKVLEVGYIIFEKYHLYK